MTIITGTEKQIAWATKIAADVGAKFANLVRMHERDSVVVTEDGLTSTGLRPDAACARWLAVEKPIIEAWLATHTDAKWWIDNRSVNVLQLAGSECRNEIRAARKAFDAK